jgi:beta-glucosidase/6-phospho-beta-glucosidase/beta-galactosidase
MATGFPAATGDILSAAMYNGLTAFTINAQTGATYTTVLTDSYQVLITQNNASANAIKIPTNASVAHPIGTVITVINIGAGTCTISAVTSGTTTVLSAGTVAAQPTLGQYKSAALIKAATDTWYVVGGVA